MQWAKYISANIMLTRMKQTKEGMPKQAKGKFSPLYFAKHLSLLGTII